MADDQVNIKFNLEAGDLNKQLTEIIANFDKLQASAPKSKDALKGVEDGAKKVGDEAKKSKEEANGLSEGLKSLADHSRTAAIGFEQLGFEAGAAASRLSGLAEVVELVGKSAPELLALGVAVGVASIAFVELADAIKTAAAAEETMVSITALLKNQGEGWKENSEAAEKYAGALALAGTFSKGDLLQGMQAMLTAGMSNNDMMASQAAAMDLAKAKGISIVEAEHELAAAYDGRLMQMKRLGLVTADEVKNGMEYADLLQRIEDRMNGTAASALDTYIGKQQNLANVIDALMEKVGNALLPAMDEIADKMTEAWNAMTPLTDSFIQWVNETMPQIKEGIDGFAKGLADLASSVLPAVFKETEIVIGAMAKFGEWFGENSDAIKTGFNVVIGVGAVFALKGLMAATWDAVAALVGLGIAEAAATLGLSAVIAALVTGAVYLSQNWNTALHNISGFWGDLVANVQNAMGAIDESLAGFDKRMADSFAKIPLIGGPIASAFQNASNLYMSDAQQQYANAAKHASDKAASDSLGSYLDAEGQGINAPGGVGKPTVAPAGKAHHRIAGTASTASTGTPFNAAAPIEKPQDTEALTKAKQALVAITVDEANAQTALNATVQASQDAATTSINAQDAQFTSYLQNKNAIVDLTRQINENKTAVEQAGSSQATNFVIYQQANAALKQVQDSLKGKTKLTNDDNAKLQDASHWQREAEADYNNSNTALKNATATLVQHEAALAKAADRTAKFIATQQGLTDSLKLTRDINIAKLQDDVNTHGLDEAQTQAYFEKKYNDARKAEQDNLNAHGENNKELIAAENKAFADMTNAAEAHYNKDYDDKKTAGDKLKDLYTKQQQDEIDAQIKAQEESKQQLQSFFDDVLTKNVGFGAALKNLGQTISQNYIKSWTDSLLGDGNSGLASMMGISSKVPSKTQSDTQAKIDKANTDLSNASAKLSSDSALISQKFGVNAQDFTTAGTGLQTAATQLQSAASAITSAASSGGFGGSGGGSGSGLGGLFGGDSGYSGPDMANASSGSWGDDASDSGYSGPDMANASSGPYGASGFNIAAVGGKLLQGYTIGTTIAGIDGGNAQWAGLLGAAGGLFGPVGGAVGGLIGSFLGPHWGPATNYPDRSDTQNYGSSLANWQGLYTANINGQNFAPDAANDQANGNKSESQQMEAWQDAMKNNTSLTQAQTDLFSKISALDAGNSSANLGVTSEHDGMLTLSNGSKISVTDMEALEQQFAATGSSGGALSATSTPVFSVTRTGPNFNTASVGGWTDNPVQAAPDARRTTQVVNINNPVIFGNTVNDVAKQISEAIQNNLSNGYGNSF